MSFGAIDYWGFADTKIKCTGGTKGKSNSGATAADSKGTTQCETRYDSVTTFQSTYEACADTGTIQFYDTATSVDFRLGKHITDTTYGDRLITSIEVGTSNTGRPTITISGQNAADSSDGNLVTPADLEISFGYGAQAIGVTAAASCYVTGSTATASVQIQRTIDSTGALCADEVYQPREEASNDLSACSVTPSATADTGWTISAGPDVTSSNTGYATGSISVFKNLALDT